MVLQWLIVANSGCLLWFYSGSSLIVMVAVMMVNSSYLSTKGTLITGQG